MYAVGYNTNPKVIEVLINAGEDPTAIDDNGNTVWDYIQKNEKLKDTPVYWKLHDLQHK